RAVRRGFHTSPEKMRNAFMSVVVNALIIIMYLYYCSHFSLFPYDVPCVKIYVLFMKSLLCIKPKCFGNTVQRYGHANKASFEFEFEFEFELEFENVRGVVWIM